jgi:hypothetical protein
MNGEDQAIESMKIKKFGFSMGDDLTSNGIEM